MIKLPARPPFNFRETVHSHGWVQLTPLSWDENAQTLQFPLRLSTGKVLAVSVSGDAHGITASHGGTLSSAEKKELEATLVWIFALDRDLSPFYAAAQAEPRLAHMEAGGKGRILRSPTLWEDVVKTITTTNTLWNATKAMCRKLCEAYGDPLPDNPSIHAFPTPERIASETPAALAEVSRMGYRAPFLHELATRIARGDLDLQALINSDLPTPDLKKELRRIKGIGDYAAANLLMLLGRSDYLPIDSWARSMVSKEWYNGEPVTDKQVAEAFARWGEWQGMAYWFWDWQYAG
jgi:3-methyladenine DNA glycosylase/8-oxoguanine DNA glycosylase